MTRRIQIVSPDERVLSAGWYGKWSNSGHDIADGLSRFEHFDKSFVLRTEASVPIDFGVIEPENAIRLSNFDLERRVSSQQLILECSKFVLRSDGINLVDHGAYCTVLIHQHIRYQMFIRKILVPQIQVR